MQVITGAKSMACNFFFYRENSAMAQNREIHPFLPVVRFFYSASNKQKDSGYYRFRLIEVKT